MQFETLIVEEKAGVAKIVLNRPDQAHSINLQMAKDLHQAALFCEESESARAVLLTSVTTVAGIMPLLLETAQQAQFLKPMVISISFGLIFGTFIVLFLLPAFLVSIESLRSKYATVHSDFARRLRTRVPAMAVASGSPARMTREDPAAHSNWSEK